MKKRRTQFNELLTSFFLKSVSNNDSQNQLLMLTIHSHLHILCKINKLYVNISKYNRNYFIFYCRTVFIFKKSFYFFYFFEQTTFINKESAMYCKDRHIVNIYIYMYVHVFVKVDYFFLYNIKF